MERYFIGNNTAYGFRSFYHGETADAEKVILLKGGPGTGKSTLMKEISKECSARGLDHELWYCSGDPSSLDGVYIKELKSQIIDATSPHALEASVPVVKETLFNLASALNRDLLMPYKSEIIELLNDKKRSYSDAYEHLNLALCEDNIINRLYKEHLDMFALKRFALSFGQEFNALYDRKASKNGKRLSTRRNAFARAITPDGEVAYYDHLRDKKIFWVRGGHTAREIFFRVVGSLQGGGMYLHCPLDPENIQGLVNEEAALTGDAGHYATGVSEAIDLSVYEGVCDFAAIESAVAQKREEVKKAVEALSAARECHLAVEKFYIAAMDFDKLGLIKKEIKEFLFG